MSFPIRLNYKIVVVLVAFITACIVWQYNVVGRLRWNGLAGVDFCREDVMNETPMGQDDPCVIEIVRRKHLHPPSRLPTVLEHPEIENPSMGQSQKILEYFKNKTGGFFIECGALDGETRSNTLYMEQKLGWSGVLIEGDPDNFEKMRQKHRKSWTVSACLSPVTHPKIVVFQQAFNLGRIQADDKPKIQSLKTKDARVQCFPIYSVLLALNRTEVDYFSLDIEGDELSVLKTIPWDRVNIKTLSVEFTHDVEGKDEIKKYMVARGYKVIAEVTHPRRQANDFLFVKE